MMHTRLSWAAGVFALGIASQAGAQPVSPVTAGGEAFGSRATLLGGAVEALTTADTGPQSAQAPGSFDETAEGGQVVEVPGVARVVTSHDSRTFGTALAVDPCSSTVSSSAGVDPAGSGSCTAASDTQNAVVDVIPGSPSLLRAVTTCSQVSLSGNDEEPEKNGKSFLSLLEINGSAIDLLTFDTETVIVADALPLVRVNRQELQTSIDEVTGLGSASLSQQALRVQAISDDGEIVQVILSGASATLTELPEECPIFRCPFLSNDARFSFITDDGCPSSADEGDEIEISVQVSNTGNGGAGLKVVNRVPTNLTLDEASIAVDDPEATFSVGPCPADVAFKGCANEPETDETRQCLLVEAGNLDKGESRTVSFRGTVNSDADVCNATVAIASPADSKCNRPPFSKEIALIIQHGECGNPTPRPTVSPTPRPTRGPTASPTPSQTEPPGQDTPGLGGDLLRTTGSGGCAVVPGTSRFDVWPILAVGLLLALRRRRGR